eukprot:1511970-Prymnesium_polylepis.1
MHATADPDWTARQLLIFGSPAAALATAERIGRLRPASTSCARVARWGGFVRVAAPRPMSGSGTESTRWRMLWTRPVGDIEGGRSARLRGDGIESLAPQIQNSSDLHAYKLKKYSPIQVVYDVRLRVVDIYISFII